MTRTAIVFGLAVALALVTGCASEVALCTVDGVDVPCDVVGESDQALGSMPMERMLCPAGQHCMTPVLPAVVLPDGSACAILCSRRNAPGLECTHHPFPRPGLTCCDCDCAQLPATGTAGLCGPMMPPAGNLENPGYPL